MDGASVSFLLVTTAPSVAACEQSKPLLQSAPKQCRTGEKQYAKRAVAIRGRMFYDEVSPVLPPRAIDESLSKANPSLKSCGGSKEKKR